MKSPRKMKVYCITQHLHDLPDHENWLTRQEAEVLAGFKFPRRCRDWLLGRWTAKAALGRFQPAAERPMTDWQVEADVDGAPMILKEGQRTEIPVSLSHRGNHALCTLAEMPMRLGCDLETVEIRSRSFEETFFTASELAMLEQQPASDRARLVTLIWSAKESALKALHTGLKADTRRVIVRSCSSDSSAWNSLEVEDSLDGGVFHGWWRDFDGMVMTVLSDQAIDPPIEL